MVSSGAKWMIVHSIMDADSQPERLYAGEFRHSIDDKNRITIPSRWRHGRPEEFILLPEATHQYSRAQHAGADRQGRLVLPEELCRKVGLKGEVALVGGQGRFEIWNLQRWKRAHEEETPTYQHVAGVIGF